MNNLNICSYRICVTHRSTIRYGGKSGLFFNLLTTNTHIFIVNPSSYRSAGKHSQSLSFKIHTHFVKK